MKAKQVIGLLWIGFIIGVVCGHKMPETSITKAEFNTLAEALVQGCAPTDDRVAMAIENYCTTKHPLTKGKTNDHGKSETLGRSGQDRP